MTGLTLVSTTAARGNVCPSGAQHVCEEEEEEKEKETAP